VHELDRVVEIGGRRYGQDSAALRRPPPVGPRTNIQRRRRRPQLDPVDFGRCLGMTPAGWNLTSCRLSLRWPDTTMVVRRTHREKAAAGARGDGPRSSPSPPHDRAHRHHAEWQGEPRYEEDPLHLRLREENQGWYRYPPQRPRRPLLSHGPAHHRRARSLLAMYGGGIVGEIARQPTTHQAKRFETAEPAPGHVPSETRRRGTPTGRSVIPA